MQDNFKENLNRKIAKDYANDIIDGLHKDLRSQINTYGSDIYDIVQDIESNSVSMRSINRGFLQDSNIQLALRLFLYKFLEENKKDVEDARRNFLVNQIVELNLQKTANDKYLCDNNANYYMLVNNKYLRQENIVQINDDGSYLTNERIANSEYYLQKLLTKDDEELELKVFHSETGIVQSLPKVVKILGLKKEVVNKCKKIGYSGNSFDCIANLVNLFNVPTASGYYMCKNCYFWKWSYKEYTLKRDNRAGLSIGSPNLSDYEYKDNNIVVRTDYTGKGLILAV